MTGSKPLVAHLSSVYYHLSENWIRTQVRHLARYQPFVLTGRAANLSAEDSPVPCYPLAGRAAPVRFLNRAARWMTGRYPYFEGILRRTRPALIHAHFGRMGYEAVGLARALGGIPVVTTFYGYDASRLPRQEPVWRERYAQLFSAGSAFLVEGPHLGQQLVELGCPAAKVHVQHLGIELERFPFRPRQRVADEPLRILAAGRFTEKKGFPDAIRALAQFLAAGGRGQLSIIGDSGGSPEEDEARAAIERAIRATDLGDRVKLLGMQPYAQLIEAYYDHHVFLSPSVEARDGNNEGGAPVTLIEASASGMPVVSTRHCDIPEVVSHRETGLLSAEGDVAALAAHLLLLYREPSELVRLGEAGHLRAGAQYDAGRQGRSLETIYDSVR